MDMVEKVRAALLAEMRKGVTNCVSDYREDGGDDEVFIDGHIDGCALARAAIKAMREPTEEMVRAARGCRHWDEENYPETTDDNTRPTWHAMIEAALSPRTSPEAPSSE